MYPQFWTTGIGGILMKYSYEYKKKCVEQLEYMVVRAKTA